MEGDVTVAVEHSTRQLQGRPRDHRQGADHPQIPARSPASISPAPSCRSTHDGFKAGDKVILNGWGVGENHHGGFAAARPGAGRLAGAVPETLTTPRPWRSAPPAIPPCWRDGARGAWREARRRRSPGHRCGRRRRLDRHRAARQARLHASSPRPAGSPRRPIPQGLGAARDHRSQRVRHAGQAARQGALGRCHRLPSARPRSPMCCRRSMPEATVAACGLAQGMDLPTSVAPFILRGVKLIGINSVTCPHPTAASAAWRRLAARSRLEQARGAHQPCPARRCAAGRRRDRRRQGPRPRRRRSVENRQSAIGSEQCLLPTAYCLLPTACSGRW